MDDAHEPISRQSKEAINEQVDQMLFSSLVIMFKILKTIRLQDEVGIRPQKRYMFGVACIMAANQCDTNSKGKPLYPKNLTKAAFLAQNYAEIHLQASNPSESAGVFSFDQWSMMFMEYLVQMFNGVMQTLDLRV